MARMDVQASKAYTQFVSIVPSLSSSIIFAIVFERLLGLPITGASDRASKASSSGERFIRLLDPETECPSFPSESLGDRFVGTLDPGIMMVTCYLVRNKT
jgi:hypothetical protein